MCECDKGHWVRHEELVKRWGNYIYDAHWTCSNYGYQPYEGADYDRKKIICLISALNVVKKWNIMNNINKDYLSSFLLDKFIIDC